MNCVTHDGVFLCYDLILIIAGSCFRMLLGVCAKFLAVGHIARLGISISWAGGERGRVVLDAFLHWIPVHLFFLGSFTHFERRETL